MSSLRFAAPLAAAIALAACVEPVDTGTAEEAILEKSERETIAKRIRAQMPGRGFARLHEPTFLGDGSRKEALFELGRALAHDKILSENQDVSCMTCHPAVLGGEDDRHLSSGVRGVGVGAGRAGGLTIPRNAPPLWNLHGVDSLFWDGRVERLADGSYRTPAGAQLTPQMTAVFEHGALSAIGMFPVTNRDEMREHGPDGRFDDLTTIPDHDFTAIWEGLMVRLRAIPEYRRLFGEAYPEWPYKDWPGEDDDRIDTMTFAHASNAMGAYFARMYYIDDTAWDSFVDGHNDAFKKLEEWTIKYLPVRVDERAMLLGAEKFVQACANCHNGPLLTNHRFHNTALAQLGPGVGDGLDLLDDFGRERVATGADGRCGLPGSGASCRYAFRTTPLRNVIFNGPWGHAGEFGRTVSDPDFETDLLNDLADLRRFVAHYAVDPASNLRAYDVNEVEEDLRPSVLPNREDIIAHIDPLFASGSPIAPEDVDNLTAFMFALSSYDILDQGIDSGSSRKLSLCYRIPYSVPSGLPLDADRADTNPDCHDGHDHW